MTEIEMFDYILKLLPNDFKTETTLLLRTAEKPKKLFKCYYWLFKNEKYKDEFITGKVLYKLLDLIDISFQVYCDVLIFGFKSPEERPKCPICGDTCKFTSFKFYTYTCGKESCLYLHYHYYSKNREPLLDNTENKTQEEIFDWTLKMFKKSGLPLLNLKDVVNRRVFILPTWLNENNLKFNRNEYPTSLENKLLNMLGTTSQIFYDVCILGLESIDERPKCIICGEECEFKTIVEGYKNVCCSEHGMLASIKCLTTTTRAKRKSKCGVYTSNVFNETFKYDSSWELDFIKYMELAYKKGFINSFKRNEDAIPYKQSDGTDHKYLPDFEITTNNNLRVVIEIKPAGLLKKDDVVRRKKYAAQKYYWKQKAKYLVLTEEELYNNINGSFWIYDYIV